jgi:imidazolonepropionase-like amidohydrolase
MRTKIRVGGSLGLGCLLFLSCLARPAAAASPAADVAAARKLFETNLQAIRDRDKAAYLACYLDSDALVRTGPTGSELGYAGLAASTGDHWPDHFDAADLRLTPVKPGLVYGTYRYRVRYGTEEDAGLSERFFVATPQGWKIAVSTAFAGPQAAPPARALAGATLVDGTGAPPVKDAVVVVRDGKIDCAGTRAACPLPAGVDVVDLTGQWITPGIIDAHVHFSQSGWADGRPDALDVRARHPYEQVEGDLRHHPERFARTYLCSGVTSVFDVGGYSWTIQLPQRAEADLLWPHVAAAGPLLSTRDHFLNLPGERQFIYLANADAARDAVRYVAEQGSSAVKVWFIVDPGKEVAALAPSVNAVGEEASRHHLPLIVHATGLAEAKAALQAGAKLLVHSVWDQPVDDEFLALVKKNGAIYCPTLTVGGGYVRMFQAAAHHQAPRVDDPNHCVDPATLAKVAETSQLTVRATDPQLERMAAGNAAEEKIGADNLKRVAAAGVPIAMGTDAGNPLTLHGPSVYAEMEAMQAAGLTPMQVLVAATRGSALAMGRQADLGTVEKGKAADLLVLAADPAADIANLRKLRYVVRGGAMRSAAELSALAATAPAAAGAQ